MAFEPSLRRTGTTDQWVHYPEGLRFFTAFYVLFFNAIDMPNYLFFIAKLI